jgi:hypothetical protein
VLQFLAPAQLSLTDYYVSPTSRVIGYESLVARGLYRGIHQDGVMEMKQELMKAGFQVAHPLLVKQMVDDPNKYDIVDGMHRYYAMSEILDEHGFYYLKEHIIPQGIPCLILRSDTPNYLLTAGASLTNKTNAMFTPMSWVDSLLNLFKFVHSLAEYNMKDSWIKYEQKEVYQHFTAFKSTESYSWSELQKKMGLIWHIISEDDCDALLEQPLAYRSAATKRSMFMELLLFDEMDFDALSRYRDLFIAQMGTSRTFKVPEFTTDLAKRKMWREISMYPTYLCRSDNAKADVRYKEYKEKSSFRKVNLIMRARFALGYWMRDPRMLGDQLRDMRKEIQSYIGTNPDFVRIYEGVLKFAEPSGMKDSLVFKAAQPKQSTLREPMNIETYSTQIGTGSCVESDTLQIDRNAWPFPNFASYKLSPEELNFSQTPQSQLKLVDENKVTSIAAEDVMRFGGRFLDMYQCGNCARETTITSFCAFHQICLCSLCEHKDCFHELSACWQINDNDAALVDREQYNKHVATIAVFQLISAATSALKYQDVFMNLWPLDNATKVKSKLNVFPCDGVLLSTCSKNAIGFCSACSRMQCGDCASRHRGQAACNFMELAVLGKAWSLLVKDRIHTGYAGLTEILRINVPLGVPVAQKETIDARDTKTYIADFIMSMSDARFQLGADYLRARYLFPIARTERKESELKARTTSTDEAKQIKANELLRSWEFAEPHARRSAFQRCQTFVTGDKSLEEVTALVSKKSTSGTRLLLSADATAHAQREILFFVETYQKHEDACRLINSASRPEPPS